MLPALEQVFEGLLIVTRSPKSTNAGPVGTDKPRRRLFTRRRVLTTGGVVVGGALVLGTAGANITRILGAGAVRPEDSPFGPYLRIEADGSVIVANAFQEMGQGVHAGLAAIVAEELDADWDRVRVETAPANAAVYGVQGTAGSNTIATSWDRMRKVGAAARAMLVQAAAARWNVSPARLTVADGVVRHAASGRSAGFGELVGAAAAFEPPQDPPLKRPNQFTLIGTPRVRRLDSLPKSTGAQIYTQDVRLPNMLTAMVARSPRFGGRLRRFDDRDARRVPGVVDVFAIPTGVAVVAEHAWAAQKGREALRILWDDSEAERRSDAEIAAWYRDIADGRVQHGSTAFGAKGDPDAAFAGDLFETSMTLPFLAHGPMEPLNCVAQVDGLDVTLWSGTQLQTPDQVAVAAAMGTAPGRVRINTLSAGGSFGRRGVLGAHYSVEAARIARRTQGRPVKVLWSREDDMAGGVYRPMAHHKITVAVDEAGYPKAWRHRAVAQALLPVVPPQQTIEGVEPSPYLEFAETVDCRVYSPRLAISTGFWRSVGHSHTFTALEHAIDQLARRANIDPADYRRHIYSRVNARSYLDVLNLACERAGWGGPIESGWARGLAVGRCFGTTVAQIAEVTLTPAGPRVRRVVAAVHCGIAVAPDLVAAQIEGGIIYGLSAGLYGAVRFRDGIVQNPNFKDYRSVRMHEAPEIETYIVPSADPPTGVGEPGTPLITPAVANALLVLTGKATRRTPLIEA
ncbi:molybdopterin cofactor-binding domain-containing protein [Brevundimonas sp. M20]|uniref:xanthine dehydrogenase family protein molybdopterin-binding subunit n=1 Tax=Brevundimonas sp. M20 TaxID=2591463 RepID=UPI0011472CBF|nr:molybdopterin cofactor-binding domain-containing protein [Brevundimonas sp. M20]QDH73526.1 xanthine dehydrogenase family protein molybdopterin-binding subunit [Brevundimonas sp. M20]